MAQRARKEIPMSRIPSGNTTEIEAMLALLYPPKFDLRSAFEAALTPAGMPDDDDAGNGDEGEGDEGDDDGSSGDGSGSSGDGDDGKGVKDPDKKRLSEEAAKHRIAAKTAQKELDKANVRLKELEDKDKSEVDKLKSDLEAATKKLEQQLELNKKAAIKLAFYDCGAADLFRNPATALKLLDTDDIEIDDDGEVDSKEIKKRADALIKEEKYLAKNAEGEGAGDGNPPSGGTNNGRKGGKADLEKEALKKKFPALQHR